MKSLMSNKPRFQYNQPKPPTLNTTPLHTVTVRYEISADLNDIQLTTADLFRAVGATSINVAGKNYQSVAAYARLESLQIWSPQSTSSGLKTGECSVQIGSTVASGQPSGVYALPFKFRATSASSDKPAHVNYVPKKNTVPGMWHIATASTSVILSMDATGGSTMDMTVSFVLNRGSGVLAVSGQIGYITGTTTVPSLGQIYVFSWVNSANVVPDGDYASAA